MPIHAFFSYGINYRIYKQFKSVIYTIFNMHLFQSIIVKRTSRVRKVPLYPKILKIIMTPLFYTFRYNHNYDSYKYYIILLSSCFLEL